MNRKLSVSGWSMWEKMLALIVVALPLLVGLAQFPKLLGDEGIYVSQAWWLVHFGKLGPYTYWYDHFPLGWLQIGLWQKLTGGPFAFGMSVISARYFMVIMVALTGLGVFQILKVLTQDKWVAWLGVVLFALSPLAVIFHRQVLLDNLATFWLVWGIYLLISAPKKLVHVVAATTFFVIGMLTKETLVVVAPVFIVAIWWFNKGEKHIRYLLSISILMMLFGAGLFGLLAWIKGELLPSPDQVSLLGTIQFQLTRGSGQFFLESGSEFRSKLDAWLFMDPLLILSGMMAMILGLVWFWKDISSRFVLMCGLMILLFLIRGGLILDFYIIPLIPFLVISIALLVDGIVGKWFWGKKKGFLFGIAIAIFGLFYGSIGRYVYTYDAVSNQLEALEYVQTRVGDEDKVVADNFFFLDVIDIEQDFKTEWPVHWYTKAALDEEIRDGVFENSAENIDYLVVNSTMQQEITGGFLPILATAQQEMIREKEFVFDRSGMGRKLLADLPYTVEDVVMYRRLSANVDVTNEIALMSEVQQFGQRILMGIEGTSLNTMERSLLQQGLVGGVVLEKTNVASSVQLTELMEDIHTSSNLAVEPAVAVLHEGGAVTAIPWLDTLAPYYWKSESEAFERGEIRGDQLSSLGFDMILAPVVDESRNDSTLTLDERTVPDTKVLAAFVQGITNFGLMPTLKYYPGMYSYMASYPEGNEVSVISISDQQLEEDILIYRDLVDTYSDQVGIMVSHGYYDQDKNNLTSTSKFFIDTLLRDSIGFSGLVLVDDVSRLSGEVNEIRELVLKSFDAGSDVVVIKNSEVVVELLSSKEGDAGQALDNSSLLKWLTYRSKWMNR